MFNDVTMNLPSYPMEKLAEIRSDLVTQGVEVFDFGTGDPQIPTWQPIRDAFSTSVPEISQYPTIRGGAELREAIWGYLGRRFGCQPNDQLDVIPSSGSKEAVFHIALNVVGRQGKRRILYPNPGYPVYRTSTLFAQGVPTPVDLQEADGYIIQPWKLDPSIQREAAALWINYPHNPTGALITKQQLREIQDWCQANDVILLSDDCYTDIYDSSWDKTGERPAHILDCDMAGTLSFMSLSKRSGLTGYRSGFIVGDKSLIGPLAKARANFGVATPVPTQKAAAVAWHDDDHVAARRKIFSERLECAYAALKDSPLAVTKPKAGFYLWCRLPEGDDDIDFALDLAKQGVICSPSQWLSEGIPGYVRFALVPELEKIVQAMTLTQEFLRKRYS